jgi:type II secretion system protein C
MEKEITSYLNSGLLKLAIWAINGGIVAFLFLGAINLGLAVYTPLHPPAIPASDTEKPKQTVRTYAKSSELKLVQKNKPEQSTKTDTTTGDGLGEVDLKSVEKIEESSLPLEVVGIAYGPVGFRMVSLRNLKKRTVKTLTAGASWSGARIREINQSDILITNKSTGKTEVLPLERGNNSSSGTLSLGTESTEEVRAVSRFQVNQAIQSNMDKLLTKVKVVPAFRKGKIIGFKISNFRGRPGKLLKRLGFRPGDVITRVNGKRINEMSQALKLWSSLRYQKDFDIQISRNGKKRSLKYELTR